MSQEFVFTEHVRDLARGNVSAEELAAPWEKLRDALISEMKHRSLLSASPSCLGIYDGTAWTKESLDELATDCYTSVFLRRLSSLAAQLERKKNVEGLVYRNIRYYLHEMQRKYDPIGFRVYTALRAAVLAAVDDGGLCIEGGDEAVRNDTLLAVAGRANGDLEARHVVVGDEDLEVVVRAWSEELLPDLVTARGAALDPVVERLAKRLTQLQVHGVSSFRFQAVSKFLKDQVRNRWKTMWAHDQAPLEEEGLWGELVRVVRPPSSFEERESFEKLVACVGDALETEPTSPKTRSYLHRLWVFLWSHAAADGDTLPSQRRLSEFLEIPRARFSDLYAILGRKVNRCHEIHSGRGAVSKPATEARNKVSIL